MAKQTTNYRQGPSVHPSPTANERVPPPDSDDGEADGHHPDHRRDQLMPPTIMRGDELRTRQHKRFRVATSWVPARACRRTSHRILVIAVSVLYYGRTNARASQKRRSENDSKNQMVHTSYFHTRRRRSPSSAHRKRSLQGRRRRELDAREVQFLPEKSSNLENLRRRRGQRGAAH